MAVDCGKEIEGEWGTEGLGTPGGATAVYTGEEKGGGDRGGRKQVVGGGPRDGGK